MPGQTRFLPYAGLTLAVVAAVAAGLALRLEDPMSTPVIPAEDPYTHMALVRGHLHDGNLDPLNDPGTLYPPGMHALLAALLVYSGADLDTVTRLAPAFFGALGLAGLGLLLARFDSGAAAIAGVLILAVMPETIFRTTMMSPTAVDLALLPFLGIAVLEMLRGRLAWAGAAAALAAFLLFSHPWLFGILGVAGLALLVLALLFPWPASRSPPLNPWGVAATIAIIGSGVAFSLAGCWGGCGPGFRDVVGPERAGSLEVLALGILGAAFLPLVVQAVSPRALGAMFPAERKPLPLAARLVVGQLLLVAVVATYIYAHRHGWPPLVNPLVMFGWPALVLALVGLAILPFRPTMASHLGAAIALGTLPFVLFNPFDSPFWSHRTAVYLAFGLAILGGAAVAALVQGAVAVSRRLATPDGPAAQPSPGSMAVFGVTGALLLVTMAGGAYAATPDQYDWYRLYPECEFEGLKEVAAIAQADPNVLVVTGTWQSKLVIAAYADDATRLWYKPGFFTSAAERDNVVQMQEQLGHPLVVVADSLLAEEHPEIDASFLEESPWVPVRTRCSDPDGATLQAYTVGGT